MSYKPGDSYSTVFSTSSPSTGAAINSDATPTAIANRNGTDDGSFVLAVTNLTTGRYKVTGTIPIGYVNGDAIAVSIAATVSSVAGISIVDRFQLDSKRVGDLNDSSYVGGAVASVTGAVGSVTAPVTVGTITDKTGYGLSIAERNAIANEILDLANSIESGETLRQTVRLIRSAILGVATDSGGAAIFKRKDGTTIALTLVHDHAGNRSSSIPGRV